MKPPKLFGLLLTVSEIFLFSACDEIRDLGIAPVPVTDIEIEIPAVVPKASMRSTFDDKFISFSSEPVIIHITDDMFADIAEYLSMIESVKVDSVNIFTVTQGNISGIVNKLTIESQALDRKVIIPSCTVGSPCSSPALVSFIQAAFDKLIDNQEIDFSISGETDLPVKTKMNYIIRIGSVFEINIAS